MTRDQGLDILTRAMPTDLVNHQAVYQNQRTGCACWLSSSLGSCTSFPASFVTGITFSTVRGTSTQGHRTVVSSFLLWSARSDQKLKTTSGDHCSDCL